FRSTGGCTLIPSPCSRKRGCGGGSRWLNPARWCDPATTPIIRLTGFPALIAGNRIRSRNCSTWRGDPSTPTDLQIRRMDAKSHHGIGRAPGAARGTPKGCGATPVTPLRSFAYRWRPEPRAALEHHTLAWNVELFGNRVVSCQD